MKMRSANLFPRHITVKPCLMPTVSELRFEQFCIANAIRFEALACDSRQNVQTPDYEIYPSDHKVAVEIKELTRNKEDAEKWDEANATGAAAGWCDTSDRIRKKISTAAKQLKSSTKSAFPGMVILFDNGTFGGIDATDIKNAMYGHEAVRVSRSVLRHETIEPHLGGGRKCTPTHNTSLSAVALLFGDRISLFHNIYAANPIPATWLQLEKCSHFSIHLDGGEGFPEWHRV